NAIHSEPCSLHDANRLDTTYLQLLNDSIAHADGYVKRAAEAALASIDQNLAQGEDPLAPADPMARRLNAAKAVQGGGGSFFVLLMPNASSNASGASAEEDADHSVSSSPATEKFTIGRPRVNFTTGDSDPVVNFTTGHQDIDFSENK